MHPIRAGLVALVALAGACATGAAPEPTRAPTVTAVAHPVEPAASTTVDVSPPPQWTQSQKLVASDGARNEWFGTSIGLVGDTAIIGAERHATTAPYAGAAYVYVRDADGWTAHQKLLASDGRDSDYFGKSVALDGGTAMVGAPHHGERPERAGAVYVFDRSAGTWGQRQKITPADANADDAFGDAVALEGDVAFLASAGNDERGASSGAVYVVAREADGWAPRQKLTGGDTRERDLFGTSVAATGGTLVVGAIGHHVDGQETGAAYVFVREGERWTQQQKLVPTDPFVTSGFGSVVAISGDTAVVGAHASDEVGELSGSVFVFVRRNATWRLQQKLLARDEKRRDHFGRSVAIADDVLLVGSNGGEAQDAGAVYVFERRSGEWMQRQRLVANDGKPYDTFGCALALSGAQALVGAYASHDFAGAAYAFALTR